MYLLRPSLPLNEHAQQGNLSSPVLTLQRIILLLCPTQVAVKVLEYTAGDSAKQGMEALLSAQLSHPNIVQTFKHCSREMAPAEQGEDSVIETWMVMEFCNKGSLSDGVDKGWFRQKNSLFDADYRTLLTSAKEVASALCYLHELNILHGDLNGNNVLLTASEKVGSWLHIVRAMQTFV
jgi:serine/threonine protein kinase